MVERWISIALFYLFFMVLEYVWYRMYRYCIREKRTAVQEKIIKIGFLIFAVAWFLIFHYGMFHLVIQTLR